MSDSFYWIKAIALIFLASSLLGAILHQKAYANQTTDAKNCKHALNAIQRFAPIPYGPNSSKQHVSCASS